MTGRTGTADTARAVCNVADAQAVARLVEARPAPETVAPTGDVVPGTTVRTIPVSGPPMPWQQPRPLPMMLPVPPAARLSP